MTATESTRGQILAQRSKDDADVVIVTISNTRKANAIDTSMLSNLKEITRQFQDARAIVITGDGDRHFCSGADISSWGPMDEKEFASDWLRHGNEVFDGFGNMPAVVIAAINGTCFGGGLELALRADVRYCSASARYAFPETGIGATPGWLGGPLLAREVGGSLASEMVLGGRIIDSAHALSAGLVSQVFHEDELMEKSLELAFAAASKSSVANFAAKRLLKGAGEMIESHVREGAMCKASDDGKEGLDAFANKRKANFRSEDKA